MIIHQLFPIGIPIATEMPQTSFAGTQFTKINNTLAVLQYTVELTGPWIYRLIHNYPEASLQRDRRWSVSLVSLPKHSDISTKYFEFNSSNKIANNRHLKYRLLWGKIHVRKRYFTGCLHRHIHHFRIVNR